MTEHSKPALDSNSPSIRNELLANISRQTTLTTQLFSILSQQPQSRASSSLPDVYAALQDASQEQAELIEKARVHQHRWKRIEAKRRRLDELDGQVRTVLVGLHEAVNELEMMVDEGTKVIKSIDAAESGNFLSCSRSSVAQISDDLPLPTSLLNRVRNHIIRPSSRALHLPRTHLATNPRRRFWRTIPLSQIRSNEPRETERSRGWHDWRCR